MAIEKTEIESILYRMKNLDREYEAIREIISGERQYYTNDLRTMSGKYLKSSLDKSIKELLYCLEDYKTYDYNRTYSAKQKRVKLTDREKEFYTAYFYLQLGMATYQDEDRPYRRKWTEPSTWGALLERIKEEAGYRKQGEIDRDLLYYDMINNLEYVNDIPYVPEGIFLDMWHSYGDVTGGSVTEIISDEERKEAAKLMTKEEHYNLDHPDKYEEKIKKEYDEIQDEEMKRDQAELEEEFREIEELDLASILAGPAEGDDSDAASSGYGERPNEWMRYFSDKERYMESCRIVHSGFCDDNAHGNIRAEATNAVILYMYKHGISKWRDESYFTVYAYLRKSRKACSINLRHEGGRDGIV